MTSGQGLPDRSPFRSDGPSSVGDVRSPPGMRPSARRGPTDAVHNLIKHERGAAFGFMSFRNYRIRSLLYAGKPNWYLLSEVISR